MSLRAGASLINMEFVQFHPTGMVWPPSVKGILVTEGVRGDGGVLKSSDGKRFMFEYVPDVFKGQYAETEQEADGWYADQDNKRRTPRRRVPRHREPPVRRGDPQAAALDVPPVQGTGRCGHHGAAHGGRTD